MIQVGEGGNERMEDKLVMSGPVVLVRGAGELASGGDGPWLKPGLES